MQLDPAYLAQRLTHFPAAKRFRVAYSGGRDSHVLLELMARWRQQQPECQLSAIHVHHGLHPLADDWVDHCKQVCRQLDIPLDVVKAKVTSGSGESPEAAARDARYAVFEANLCPDEGLLLAHHQDDQAETLLLQLLRGAGSHGLASMPDWTYFSRGWLARPLLPVPRSVIEEYAKCRNLIWVDDTSNQDRAFDRNYLRHEVFPVLRQRWPSVGKVLSRAAGHQAEARLLLNQIAEQDWQQLKTDSPTRILLDGLLTLEPVRQRNLLRYWIGNKCRLSVPDTCHLNRILTEVLSASIDAVPCVSWPGGEVRRYREQLFAGLPLRMHDSTQIINWDLQSSLVLPGRGVTLAVERIVGRGLSSKRLQDTELGISIRFRRGGERCQPLGRHHHHELKKLFQEWGIPPWLRDRVPLLYVGEELAQVVGYCLCQPYAAHKKEAGLEVFTVSGEIFDGFGANAH